MTIVPMILMETGANLLCERVTFLGKCDTNSILSARPVTYAAIGTTTGSVNGTILKINNCFLDGLGVGVEFDPAGLNYGDTNYLSIQNTRARLFGKENTAAKNTCLAYFTTCNALFTDNYILFISDAVGNPICFVKDNNPLLNREPKIIITNNFGGRESGSQTVNLFYDNGSTTDSEFVIAGNSISNRPQNEWYLTVGGGMYSTSYGDVNGYYAVDFVIQYMQNINATVYINAGTYEVKLDTIPFSSAFSKLKLIGIKNGILYPTIKLDLNFGAITDVYGFKTLSLSNELRHIQFQSINSSNYNSISLSYSGVGKQNNGELIVEDCSFTDVLLLVKDINQSQTDPITANTVSSSIVVKNCQFFQSNNFATDHLSIILPFADNVLLDSCTFKGKGYIGGIGRIGNSYNYNLSNVTINNCIMDKTGYTISSDSPASINSYFIVNGMNSNLNLRNCSITAKNDFSLASSTIDSSLLSANKFANFISLTAKSITIENSIFNGPDQEYTDTGVNYAVTNLYTYAYNYLNINNSKFLGGALPLYVTGIDVIGSGSGCFINNSIFKTCYAGGKSFCHLLIDIGDVNTFVHRPSIKINNCDFSNINTSSSSHLVKNYNNTIDILSTVTISANNFNVYFSNSTINAKLKLAYSITKYAGLYINNWDISPPGDYSECECFVNNNSIIFENPSINGLDTNNNSDFVFSAFLKSYHLNVNDNTFTMNNKGTAYLPPDGCNYAGHLYLINKELPTTSANNASAIISDNIFNKVSEVPGPVNKKASILIDGDSTSRGLIVDNIFSSPYLNPNLLDPETYANTNLVSIDGTLINWTIERNKNQTVLETIGVINGKHIRGVTDDDSPTPSYYPELSGKDDIWDGSTTKSSHLNSYSDLIGGDGTQSLKVIYDAPGSPSYYDFYLWDIYLADFLPRSVKIIYIETSFQSQNVVDPVGGDEMSASLEIINVDGTTQGVPYISEFDTTDPILVTISNINYQILNYYTTIRCYLKFYVSGVDQYITISPITIKYRW